MSKLRQLMEQMRSEACASRHLDVYVAACARHAVLAECPDMAAVFRKLSDDREHTYPEREALTRALMREHRAGNGPIWSHALAVAYYPMLSRLRHRIVGDTVARDDLDQLVFLSFMASLRDVPDSIDRLALRLRQRTQRLVFRFIRRERAERHQGMDIDDLGDGGISYQEMASMAVQPVEQEKREKLAKLVTRVAEGELPPDSLDIILSTVIGHERLRAYVKRTVSGDEVTQERVYQRLKRKRTRALKRIRKLIANHAAMAA